MNILNKHPNRCKISYINGTRLARALTAGFEYVLTRESLLNEINVFPVPDRDTGTNLAISFTGILEMLKRYPDAHAGKLLVRISETALNCGSGNAGAIFAHFFHGLSLSAAGHARLNAREAATAMKMSAEHATLAMHEPAAGTILSVIDAFTEQFVLNVQAGVFDFQMLLNSALVKANQALAETPNQLDVLKNAGVVDAGGQGFVDFLQGISKFIADGSLGSMRAHHRKSDPGHYYTAETGKHSYCVECLITREKINRDELEAGLSSIGDDILLGGSKNRIRVHIHTTDPEGVFMICSRFGEVGSKRTVCMSGREQPAPQKRKTVAIVTDSVADFPDLEALDIHVIPVRFSFGKTSYLDKVSLTASEFYRELTQNPSHPKTSQPSPGDFRRIYKYLYEHYKSVISIHLADVLSGTFQSARNAIQQVPGNCITLLDSCTVSVSQGLLVMAAAEASRAGKSHKFIVKYVESLKSKTQLFAALADLSYVVKGGRIPGIVNSISNLLHLKPVLSTRSNGDLFPAGVLFGKRKTPKKLCRFLLKRIDTTKAYRAIVGHSDSPERGQQMVNILKQKIPRLNDVFLIDIGGGLGVHAGPGAIAVGLQELIPFK